MAHVMCDQAQMLSHQSFFNIGRSVFLVFFSFKALSSRGTSSVQSSEQLALKEHAFYSKFTKRFRGNFLL